MLYYFWDINMGHLEDKYFVKMAGELSLLPPINIDIDGRNRDSEGDDWDIGADQCEDCSEGGAVTNTAFMIFMDM